MARKPANSRVTSSDEKWQPSDFVFSWPKRDETISPAAVGIVPTYAMMQSRFDGPPIQGRFQQPATTSPSQPLLPATANTPADQIGKPMTEQEQIRMSAPGPTQPVRDYLANPDQLQVPTGFDITKSFLSQIFDSSDTYDETKQTPDNPTGYVGAETTLESNWDSFLRGMKWTYDRVNQAGVLGVSVAPGGLQTLSWDQANDISYGQASIAAGAALQKQYGDQPGIGGVVTGLLAGATSPFAVLGAAQVGEDWNPALANPNFDITNPADRKAAFEDSAVGKWTTGVADATFVMVADPLIFGGKALKLSRLRYLDRLIDSPERLAEVVGELNAGAARVNQVRAAQKAEAVKAGAIGALDDMSQFRDLAPVAQFAAWVTQKAPDGTKLVERGAIANHRSVRWATNREGLVSALYNAEDYDEAALVIRSIAGDVSAQADLLTKRADLAAEIGDAQRQLNWLQMVMDPKTQAERLKKADDVIKDIRGRMDQMRKQGAANTPMYAQERLRLDQAVETKRYIKDFDPKLVDPLDPLVLKAPDAAAAAKKAVQEMMRRDKYFSNALLKEQGRTNSLFGDAQMANGGFASDNPIGRIAERSRQSRAQSAFEASATRRARTVGADQTDKRLIAPWKRDVYGNNGLSRAINLWRWPWEEKPSGAITTTGIGSQESSRELRATMNELDIYSGEAKFLDVPKTYTAKDGTIKYVLDKNKQRVVERLEIGGARRKEQLIGQYMDALQRSTQGDYEAATALRMIEEQIMNDIAAWHGIDKISAKALFEKTSTRRDQLVAAIRDEGFWVENKDIHKSPWLETHFQNGTYLLNFKAFEERAAMYGASPAKTAVMDAARAGKDFTEYLYDAFDDIWRPMVLLRFGYTQRNIAEGLVRASAFEFSLDPVGDAVATGALSARNAWVKRSTLPAVRRAEKEMRIAQQNGSVATLPAKYHKWRATQVAARDQDIANHLMTMQRIGLIVAGESRLFLNEQKAFWASELKEANANVAALRKSGASSEEIDIANGYVEIVNDTIAELKAVRVNKTPNPNIEAVRDDWKTFEAALEYSRAQRAILDNDLMTVALFRKQGIAKRRVHDGQVSGPDGSTWKAAFNPESPFTPIAMALASSDNTNKAMASLRSASVERAFKATIAKYNVAVNPDRPEYFDTMAAVIRQFAYSEVGRMVVQGKPMKEITDWLLTTPRGREVAEFVSAAQVKGKPGPKISIVNRSSANDYVRFLYDRWQTIAPTQEIRDFVKGTDLNTYQSGKGGWNGKVVEDLVGQRDQAGNFVNRLVPLVGNIVEETGRWQSPRKTIKFATDKGMQYLGTKPEDAFLRLPFYGRRFEATRATMYRMLAAQDKDGYVSMRELAAIDAKAHARALKDTKDWLFTIDRRTKLGAYGEMVFPFIGSSQNSVTTVGRLIWRDPSVLPIGINLYSKVPQELGIEDENGNLVFTFWKDMIPKQIQEKLGLDNMLDTKIPKSGLNTILQETGFFVLPRLTPLVAAPYSEFMKHSMFGQTPYAPDAVTAIFGEEKGNGLWNLWKSYVFGEGQGPSDSFLSYEMLTSPASQKVIQVMQGNNSSQFAYMANQQMNMELAKIWSGERDAPESLEDLAQEVHWKTVGYQLVRWLGNMLAFTPPQYTTKLDPLINTVRWYDKEFGLDGSRMAMQNLGPSLMALGDFSGTRKVAGLFASTDSVKAAERYSGLISRAASEFLQQSGDLSLIGMLVTRDPNDMYDPSSASWMKNSKIPGINEYYSKMQTPQEQQAESRRNVGWTEWISRVGVIDSLLQQAGFTSYRSAGAAEYKAMKDSVTYEMSQNPVYSSWYADYKDASKSRTDNAIRFMELALSDETFVKDNFSDDGQVNTLWEGAWYYMKCRKMVIDALEQSGKGINHESNAQIRDFWDTQRQALINEIDGWSPFANRWLNGDDDPQNTGAQFGVIYADGGGIVNE